MLRLTISERRQSCNTFPVSGRRQETWKETRKKVNAERVCAVYTVERSTSQRTTTQGDHMKRKKNTLLADAFWFGAFVMTTVWLFAVLEAVLA